MELKGSVVLVTGANRGIGAALVEALVAAGAGKVYAAMRTPPAAVAGSVVVPIALDITDEARLAEVAKEAGDVDVVINNAGISLGQTFLHPKDPKAAAEEMRVNYFGTLSVIRAFAPVLKRNGGGAIVNVLSILGRVSLPTAGSYSASKAAALSLTQGVRAELRSQGTLVMGVMPGFVDTDMTARVTSPKMPPSRVAYDVVSALRSGTEDVYPGEAAQLAAQLLIDPKGVEETFASFLHS